MHHVSRELRRSESALVGWWILKGCMVCRSLAHELLLRHFHVETDLIVLPGSKVGLTFSSRLIDLLIWEIKHASVLSSFVGLLDSQNYLDGGGISFCHRRFFWSLMKVASLVPAAQKTFVCCSEENLVQILLRSWSPDFVHLHRLRSLHRPSFRHQLSLSFHSAHMTVSL